MNHRDGFFWNAIDAGTEISPVATLLDAGDGERPFRVRFQGRPELSVSSLARHVS